jgi:SAM-dependent methyltransferase
MATPDWSGAQGDIWARRWRETDRALADVGRALDAGIREAAPSGPFRALDVGCGPGTTSLNLATERPDAAILGCDLSQALVAIARERSEGFAALSFVAEDAEAVARDHAPFELIFSRHGVMFFDDPYRAFRSLRAGAAPGAGLVFSCFQAWESNVWAAELADAAAGAPLPPPRREPSGFAFAEVDYVRDILGSSGWAEAEPRGVEFDYVAGEGADAAERALSFLAELGPAARIIEGLDPLVCEEAIERMRKIIRGHEHNGRVTFRAAAWIWTAAAA